MNDYRGLTPSITPENTGIGSWTEDTFIQALRTGRHVGVSRPIMPPMPWQNCAHRTDGVATALTL